MRRILAPALLLVWVVGRSETVLAQQKAAIRLTTGVRDGQSQNRWRYVWHNDHWWYWATGEHWSYFDGRRWARYELGRPLSGSLTAGYRKAPAFERPPAAPPEPPRSWTAEAMERETGLSSSYYFEGGPTTAAGMPLGSELRPVLGGAGSTRSASPRPGGMSESGYELIAPIVPRAGRTGGGAFGGPTGKSLGAGSAAGGASTPQ